MMQSDASESDEIDNNNNDFIDNTINDENLDTEMARLCSKKSEFNQSVAKSENSEVYSSHS